MSEAGAGAAAGGAAAAGGGTGAAGSATANKFGRTSELRLVAETRGGATVLADVFATMPFKVMSPFAVSRKSLVGVPEAAADPVQAMVMAASAGIMAGDAQSISVQVGEGAALQVTTQAFEKVHRMDEASATRRTRLAVAEGAYLDYSPQPVIPFAGSDFSASTEVELAGPGARLVYEEVLSCGRVARGERFGYRRFANHVVVRCGGVPVYLDNTVFDPAAMPMEDVGFFEGFTHLANLVLVGVPVDEAAFLAARDWLRDQTGVIGAAAGSPVGAAEGADAVAGGITRLACGGVAVRLLGHRAQRLTDVLARVRGLIA